MMESKVCEIIPELADLNRLVLMATGDARVAAHSTDTMQNVFFSCYVEANIYL